MLLPENCLGVVLDVCLWLGVHLTLVSQEHFLLSFVNGEKVDLSEGHIDCHDQVLHIAGDYIYLKLDLVYLFGNQAFQMVFLTEVGELLFVDCALIHNNLVLIDPTGEHDVDKIDGLVGCGSS